MDFKKLAHADKISTHTDRKVISVSIVCDALSLALLTALLILKLALSEPIVLLLALLAMAAGACFVISLVYTTALRLRKKSVKIYLSIMLLIIAAALTVPVIVV